MDEHSVLARLDRIAVLDRSGAAPAQLLTELRGLLCEAEQGARVREPSSDLEEVVERLGTAPHRT